MTPYLLFPLLKFWHFALFYLLGLLLLLLFEGVVIREEAVQGREGNGAVLPFIVLICAQRGSVISVDNECSDKTVRIIDG